MPRLVIGTVALLLSLAGCGGDPKTEPSPTPSTAPASATPSPATTAPVMPAEASANTKAGAIAFVRYYVELINYAQATGDVHHLAAVENAGCASCSRARDALTEIYDAGGLIRGGALTFSYSSASRSPRYGGWLVSGSLRFAPETVTRKAGAPAESLSGGAAPVNAFVSNRDSAHGWQVMDWTRGS